MRPSTKAAGIIINPAAYTFTSLALLDALKMFPGPIIELHITNIHRRESMYHHSSVSKIATAVIAGLGTDGYRVAVDSDEATLGKACDPGLTAQGRPVVKASPPRRRSSARRSRSSAGMLIGRPRCVRTAR